MGECEVLKLVKPPPYPLKTCATMTTPTIAIPIFPSVNVLDVTGPVQVFATPIFPSTVTLVARDDAPIKTSEGVRLVPDATYASCPQADILLVPGGPGISDVMKDELFMAFIRTQGASAKFVASTCTGSLLLGLAGLLDGYKATTHWDSIPCLRLFPNVTVADGYPRFVVDGNRVTAAGVSAGLDAALQLLSLLPNAGPTVAQEVELLLQYAPRPPFVAGDPSIAPPSIVRTVTSALSNTQRARMKEIREILGERSMV